MTVDMSDFDKAVERYEAITEIAKKDERREQAD